MNYVFHIIWGHVLLLYTPFFLQPLMNGVTIIPTKIVTGRPLIVGAFQIVAGFGGNGHGIVAVVAPHRP